MICPRCQNPLPDGTDSCRCGWRERTRHHATEQERIPRTDCGYEGCHTEAICKLKTPTGWLHVCDQHYRQYHHAKAEAYCAHRGLDTLAKRKAWLRQHWPQAQAWDTTPTREPGEDREEPTI